MLLKGSQRRSDRQSSRPEPEELRELTPFGRDDWGWLAPRLRTSVAGHGLRGFAVDGYVEMCKAAGQGEPAVKLANAVGRYPGLAFMPIDLAMLLTFSCARWLDPDSHLPDAMEQVHFRAVSQQMSGGIVGRPLVLAADGCFKRFIKQMTLFPNFSVNFGKVHSESTGERSLVVHHDDFYSWHDCLMTGTYRALGAYFGHEIDIEVVIEGPMTMDHYITW